MWLEWAFIALFAGVFVSCIPFGRDDMSLLDRFRGIRTPAEHDNKGLD